jgi:hypothetical protein
MTDVPEAAVEAVARAIGGVDQDEKGYPSDNLAIVLCSDFERHGDCPENDTDEDLGWSVWAMEQEKMFRTRIASAAITAYLSHLEAQGMCVAPMEPTNAMIVAYMAALKEHRAEILERDICFGFNQSQVWKARARYKAMLAAREPR